MDDPKQPNSTDQSQTGDQNMADQPSDQTTPPSPPPADPTATTSTDQAPTSETSAEQTTAEVPAGQARCAQCGGTKAASGMCTSCGAS